LAWEWNKWLSVSSIKKQGAVLGIDRTERHARRSSPFSGRLFFWWGGGLSSFPSGIDDDAVVGGRCRTIVGRTKRENKEKAVSASGKYLEWRPKTEARSSSPSCETSIPPMEA
jgi:hypothetical protein